MLVARGDVALLFSTRILRLFCYGFLSIVLALYLARVGLSEGQIGILFSLTLAGDAGITLWLTTSADRFGRRRILILGAALMLLAGIAFIFTRSPLILMAAAVLGVISPSGSEIGPFLSVEQASLSQLVPDRERTRIFAWYNVAGSFATALGALAAGSLVGVLQARGMPVLGAYRTILTGYAAGGLILMLLFLRLSAKVEVAAQDRSKLVPTTLGLHRSRDMVMRLSALFALDAFAGGLIL